MRGFNEIMSAVYLTAADVYVCTLVLCKEMCFCQPVVPCVCLRSLICDADFFVFLSVSELSLAIT